MPYAACVACCAEKAAEEQRERSADKNDWERFYPGAATWKQYLKILGSEVFAKMVNCERTCGRPPSTDLPEPIPTPELAPAPTPEPGEESLFRKIWDAARNAVEDLTDAVASAFRRAGEFMRDHPVLVGTILVVGSIALLVVTGPGGAPALIELGKDSAAALAAAGATTVTA